MMGLPAAVQAVNALVPTADQLRHRRLQRALWGATIATVVLLLLRAPTPEDMIGSVVIAIAALAPAHVWAYRGAATLPILPLVAAVHVVYFALPLVSEHPDLIAYDGDERLAAAYTVLLFLLASTAGWAVAGAWHPPAKRALRIDGDPRRLAAVVLAAMAGSFAFQVLAIGGQLQFLAEWYSVARAFVWNMLFAATFTVGVLIGEQRVDRRMAASCVAVIALNVMTSWVTLFLVGGILVAGVGLVGYMLGSRRIPFKTIALALVLAALLHAGKGEMRERYWPEGGQYDAIRFGDIPSRLVEWLGAGLRAFAADDEVASIAERASLMQMLLRAESMSPDPIPYLGGETYALIPGLLVPRFVDPDKPATQAGMDRLNVRYGVLTREDVQTTAVGWGLMSEAYANFGLVGVIVCGLMYGGLIGFVTGWAANAPPLSARTMLSIVVLAGSMSLEADAATYLVSLFQAAVAVLVLSHVITWCIGDTAQRGPHDARMLSRLGNGSRR